MPTGSCALCLTVGVEIRDSHMLAAAFYRRVRGPSGNPMPVGDTNDHVSNLRAMEMEAAFGVGFVVAARLFTRL